MHIYRYTFVMTIIVLVLMFVQLPIRPFWLLLLFLTVDASITAVVIFVAGFVV